MSIPPRSRPRARRRSHLIPRRAFELGLVLAAAGAQAQTPTPSQAPSPSQAQLQPPAAASTAPAGRGGEATLPTVTVVGDTLGDLPRAAPGGQIATGGSLGQLGTSDVMDVPFSTVTYTADFLEDSQARTAADMLINDASVNLTTARGGFADTYQIRGFAVPEGDVGFNGLYGLIPPNRVSAELIERLELIKGPTSFINGMAPGGSIGGGINIVSKRAGPEPLNRVTTTYVGKQNLGLLLDLSRRFGEDNAWGVRFNGLARGGEGSIDGGNQKTTLGSLALEYDRGGLRWSLDAFAKRDDTDEFRPQINLQGATSVIPRPPNARLNFYPGTTLVQDDRTAVMRVEYDANASFTAYGGIGYRDGTNDQLFPVTSNTANDTGDFNVRSTYYDAYSKTWSGNAGLRWRVATGPVRHTVTAAFASMKQEAGFAYIQGGQVASNIYRPSPLAPIDLPRTDPARASDTTLTSLSLADTMGFLDDRLLVTLGLRDQKVDVQSYNTTTGAKTTHYDKSSVAPLIGLVYRLNADTSVYGNYTTGLSRGATVGAGYANTGASLAPFKSKQYEAGLKARFGRIMTSAAVFQIQRPATGVDLATNVFDYYFEQRNRGLELSAYGELRPGLRGIASLAFIDPSLNKTPNGVNQGHDAAGVPDKRASIGLDWDAPWVRGLAFNGRVIYTSGAYLTDANSLRFNSWTRFDIGTRYVTEVMGKPVVLRAAVENLFDKSYWLTAGTYVTVGAPRTLMLSASFDL